MKLATLVLTILGCTIASLLTAQSTLPEFGKIELSDLQLKECPFDKSAAAMVLFDSEEISFRLDGSILRTTTERRMRIKIFSEKGFEHANIKIRYLSRRAGTKLKDISGVIYNLDAGGKILVEKIDKKQIFRDKTDENIRKLSFTFPGIKNGSVVEYRFTKMEINSIDLNPWILQDKIPVKLAMYNITLPSYLDLKYRFRSLIPVEKLDTIIKLRFNSGYERKVILSAQNILPFSREPFMSSLKDNMHRVEFSLSPTFLFLNTLGDNFKWDLVNDYLYRSPQYGGKIFMDITGTKGLVDTVKKLSSKDERIAYLFKHLRDQIKWDGSRSFYAGDLQECWNNKAGNSSELNLLFLNLLRKAGVDAKPILISTRENGKPDKEFVNLGQFNGIDVWVPDSNSTYVLDLTQKHTSHKIPPYNVLFRNAFAIDSLRGDWIYIADYRHLMRTLISVKAELDSSENVKGDAAIFSYDYAKEEVLKAREKEEKDEDEEEVRDRKLITLTTSNYSEENAQNIERPLTEKFSYTYEVTKTNDLYYFNPMFLSSLRDNPFTANIRQTDIDLGCIQQFIFQISLTIPNGFIVESMPPGVLLRNSDTTISFKRQTITEGQQLFFKITLDYNYPHFTKEEYPSVQEFFKKLYALLNEQIVLRKMK